MKVLHRKIIIIIALVVGFLFVGNTVLAVDSLSVEFQNDPLFSEANFLPGDNVTRWVKVTNYTSQTQKVLVQATNFTNPIPTDDLCHALMITISQNGVDLYGGSSATGPKTLCDFYQESNNSPIYLSDIHNGETIQYDFSILFSSDSNNEWQEKTTYFDIVIGFEEGESEGEGQTPGGGGTTMTTMGGGGGGYSGLIIFNEQNQEITADQVVLTWFTNHPATSRVIYDTVSHSTIGAPPNYGYAFSTPEDSNKVTFHTVTLTGLTPGVTYYWRAISHGSGEVWGRELSFTIPETKEQPPGYGPPQEGGPGEIPGEEIPGQETKPSEEKIAEGETGALAPPGEGEEIVQTEGAEKPSKESAPPKKGFINWVSSGLASIIDALKGFLGRISICQLIILILILIILYLLYLLYKKKKREKTASKTINLGPPSSSQ